MGNSKSKGEPEELVPRPFAKDGKGFMLSDNGQKIFANVINKKKEEHLHILEIPYAEYEYDFENIAFEGGGTKGGVYAGVVQVLEEAGIKHTRFAGASAGAFTAALLAAGYTAEEYTEICKLPLGKILMDHSCGVCSLLPNLVRHYGWNPGKHALKFFGQLLDDKLKLGPGVTFKQLYEATGNELCITAVNVNLLSLEYFHPKTTPDLAINLALRMSVAIPGLFQPQKIRNDKGQKDVYVDGGVLCNYPLHAFDGWWLSMKNEDCFLNRLQPLSECERLMSKKERFGNYNEKTIGCLVYSATEQDVMKTRLEEERFGLEIACDERPHSKVCKKKLKMQMAHEEMIEEHNVFLEAFDRLLKTLRLVNSHGDTVDATISKEELKQALDSATNNTNDDKVPAVDIDPNTFSSLDIEILFGTKANMDDIFDTMDSDHNEEISYAELIKFIDRAGIDVASKLRGYQRKEIKSIGDFLNAVQDSLLTNTKYLYIDERDFDRTIGINSDYIDTEDVYLSAEDSDFLVQQGRKATISFLRHHVHDNNLQKKAVTKEPEAAVDQSVSGNQQPSSEQTPHDNQGFEDNEIEACELTNEDDNTREVTAATAADIDDGEKSEQSKPVSDTGKTILETDQNHK